MKFSAWPELTDLLNGVVDGEALRELRISSTDECNQDIVTAAALGWQFNAGSRDLGLRRSDITGDGTINRCETAVHASKCALNKVGAR